MKYIKLRIVCLLLIWLSGTYNTFAQKEVTAKEARIQLEQIIDSLDNKWYTSLAHLLELKIRYVDLVRKTDTESEEKIRIYANASYYFFVEGLPTESIRCYKLLLNEYGKWKQDYPNDTSDQFLPNVSFAYGIMARSFGQLNQLDSATFYQQKAIFISRNSQTIYFPSALNNYGLLLNKYEQNIDSVKYYFQWAFDITKEQFPNNALLGSIRDNLADLYLKSGETEKASEFYRQNFNYYRSDGKIINDIPRLVSAAAQLIQTNILHSDVELGIKNLRTLESSIADTIISSNAQLELWNVKHQLLKFNNQSDSAYLYAQKALLLTESLNDLKSKKSNDFTYALNDIVLDRVNITHELQQNKKENQLRTQRLLNWVIVLISFIGIGIIYFLYQKRNQRLVNAENEKLITDQAWHLEKLKSDQLKTEIASKERDLSDFAINLSHNFQWARELQAKFKIINQTKGRTKAKLIDDLEKDIRNKIDFDSETKHFLHRLDLLNDAFYKKLDDHFPHLTKTDKRLCSLIRLKLESQQIANFQNITLASVNTARYRLRKKLNLAEEEDLDHFIVHL